MPTYVYKCENPECGVEFELNHPIVEILIPKVCPACGDQTNHRIPQVVPVKGAN